MMAAAVAPAWAAAPEQPKSWVDRDHFPEAYGILTSDRVMFPDSYSHWPLKIDSTHQLFIDDCLMSQIEGLTREFHQPTKHPANPLMPGGYVAVLYDKDNGFRMWNNVYYFNPSVELLVMWLAVWQPNCTLQSTNYKLQSP